MTLDAALRPTSHCFDHLVSDVGSYGLLTGLTSLGLSRRVTISAAPPLRSGSPPFNELAVRHSNEFYLLSVVNQNIW